MTKASLQAAVEQLPENFDLDAFLEDLVIIEKIEKGRKELSDGKGKTHDEVLSYFKTKWQK